MDDAPDRTDESDEATEGTSGDDEGTPMAVRTTERPDAEVPGATPHERAAVRRARSVSRLLDEAVRVPGTDFRVGLDPVLGIVPGAGDAIAAALSLYPVAEAYRLDVPSGTLAKMVGLVAIDAVVGSIPVLGPVFDAFWKANEWNVRLLERHLERSG